MGIGCGGSTKSHGCVERMSLMDVIFDGVTYDHIQDFNRLNGQLRVIFDLMSDGAWRTLSEIAERLSFPEASVSAQLRNLRKPRFGGFLVERRIRGERSYGLYEYRLETIYK